MLATAYPLGPGRGHGPIMGLARMPPPPPPPEFLTEGNYLALLTAVRQRYLRLLPRAQYTMRCDARIQKTVRHFMTEVFKLRAHSAVGLSVLNAELLRVAIASLNEWLAGPGAKRASPTPSSPTPPPAASPKPRAPTPTTQASSSLPPSALRAPVSPQPTQQQGGGQPRAQVTEPPPQADMAEDLALRFEQAQRERNPPGMPTTTVDFSARGGKGRQEEDEEDEEEEEEDPLVLLEQLKREREVEAEQLAALVAGRQTGQEPWRVVVAQPVQEDAVRAVLDDAQRPVAQTVQEDAVRAVLDDAQRPVAQTVHEQQELTQPVQEDAVRAVLDDAQRLVAQTVHEQQQLTQTVHDADEVVAQTVHEQQQEVTQTVHEQEDEVVTQTVQTVHEVVHEVVHEREAEVVQEQQEVTQTGHEREDGVVQEQQEVTQTGHEQQWVVVPEQRVEAPVQFLFVSVPAAASEEGSTVVSSRGSPGGASPVVSSPGGSPVVRQSPRSKSPSAPAPPPSAALHISSASRDWRSGAVSASGSRYDFSVQMPHDEGEGMWELLQVVVPEDHGDDAVSVLSLPYVHLRVMGGPRSPLPPPLPGTAHRSPGTAHIPEGGGEGGTLVPPIRLQYASAWQGNGMGHVLLEPPPVLGATLLRPSKTLRLRLERPDGSALSDVPDCVPVARAFFADDALLVAAAAASPGVPSPSSSSHGGSSPGSTLMDVPGTPYAFVLLQAGAWFCRFAFMEGERLVVHGYRVPFGAAAAAGVPSALVAAFEGWVNAPEGHRLMGIAHTPRTSASVLDGHNDVGYAQYVAVRAPFEDPSAGGVQRAYFGGSEEVESGLRRLLAAAPAAGASATGGRMLNASRQVHMTLRRKASHSG